MFEKEAEEWADKGLTKKYTTLEWYARKNNFQKGAEFGYNKGYHDAEEHYMNVIDSQHKLVEESKANEWHYVKDGDLPEDNKIVLFYTTYFDFWVGGIEPKNDKKHRWEVLPSVSGDYYAEDEVIAWKEIVLPKESEI